MQDTENLSTLLEEVARESRIAPVEHDAKPSPTGDKHQKTVFRTDAEMPQRTARRRAKRAWQPAPPSDRGGWWQKTIKDTPDPGAYDTHLNTFVKEITARPMTYGFKNHGRKRDPQPLEPKGKDLLPGAYSIDDFAEKMHRLPVTYGFKGPTREDVLKKSIGANHDKDIDVAPGLYETQNYHTINAPIESAKHSFFVSKTRRKIFLPKIGPAPGDYDPKIHLINTNSPNITSSFRSSTDRFFKKPSIVPGPGTYDKLTVFPLPKQIDSLAARGIFFSASFVHTATAFG